MPDLAFHARAETALRDGAAPTLDDLHAAFAVFGPLAAHLRDPASTGRIARLRRDGQIDAILWAQAHEDPTPLYVAEGRKPRRVNVTLQIVYAWIRTQDGPRGPVEGWVAA